MPRRGVKLALQTGLTVAALTVGCFFLAACCVADWAFSRKV